MLTSTMAPRSTLDSAERSVSDQCSRLGTKPLDARERKRDQNRAAQRTYRRYHTEADLWLKSKV